jgi:hypothetical protein
VIKVVKKILFMFVLVAGLSMASMAQKGGDDPKRPPKPQPPVINPGKGNPPRENPKGGDKPKKPGGGEAMMFRKKDSAELA